MPDLKTPQFDIRVHADDKAVVLRVARPEGWGSHDVKSVPQRTIGGFLSPEDARTLARLLEATAAECERLNAEVQEARKEMAHGK